MNALERLIDGAVVVSLLLVPGGAMAYFETVGAPSGVEPNVIAAVVGLPGVLMGGAALLLAARG